MPLKLMFFGPRVAGKSSHAAKLAEKYGVDLKAIAEEIRKFTQYWTEPNKSGTRQRWETEKTFEVSRRLEKWFSNIKQFKQTEKKGTLIL